MCSPALPSLAVLPPPHTQIHTPDSSRYWLADSYESRLAAGQEPQNIDKEFLRLWFRERCDPYKDEVGGGLGGGSVVRVWCSGDGEGLWFRRAAGGSSSSSNTFALQHPRLSAVHSLTRPLTRPPTHTRPPSPPKKPQVLPEAPRELVEELSRRYVYLYERITGQPFAPPALDEPVKQRMERNVAPYL